MKKKIDLAKSKKEKSVSTEDAAKNAIVDYSDQPEDIKKTSDFFVTSLEEVFHEKHDFFLHEITEKLKDLKVAEVNQIEQPAHGRKWIQIESLSRLRAEVGGRFQNIKAKWMEAGLPLREHRGDRNESSNISQEGWLNLSSWISNQGFESRITPDSATSLFELENAN